jgi:hypothetical protein
MGGGDMIKASVLTFIAGVLIWFYGLFAFIFILELFLGGFF